MFQQIKQFFTKFTKRKCHAIQHLNLEWKYLNKYSNDFEFWEYVSNIKPAFEIIISKFCDEGLSGCAAQIYASRVAELIKNALLFKNIFPIDKGEEEFIEVVEGTLYQSRRCLALFKNINQKYPYYLDAIVWEEDGCVFTGEVTGITSRQYIKYPFIPQTFYVKVRKIDEDNYEILDRETLSKALQYYRPFTSEARQFVLNQQ